MKGRNMQMLYLCMVCTHGREENVKWCSGNVSFLQDSAERATSPETVSEQPSSPPPSPTEDEDVTKPEDLTLPSPGDNLSFAEDEDIVAPELPNAPPPVSSPPHHPMVPSPASPSYQKKEVLSPPLSPTGVTQKKVDVVSIHLISVLILVACIE